MGAVAWWLAGEVSDVDATHGHPHRIAAIGFEERFLHRFRHRLHTLLVEVEVGKAFVHAHLYLLAVAVGGAAAHADGGKTVGLLFNLFGHHFRDA